jgi:hypothetical protein
MIMTTIDGVSSAHMPFENPAWRLIHAYYLDAAAQQKSANLRDALADEIGNTFEGFIRACGDQLIIISAEWRADGLHYCVAVRVSDGMMLITYVHASRLGMETPENEATSWPGRCGAGTPKTRLPD